MVREVEQPAPVANGAADLHIDEQRVVDNQGLGDLLLARLQMIRGIRRTGSIGMKYLSILYPFSCQLDVT